jgi:hypothetical protein
MTLTLAKAIFLTLAELGQCDIRTATGGSTTTVVDTTLPNLYEDEESLIGGGVFISYDVGGAAAAPEGQYKTITNYDPATGTITFTAMTIAPAAGDEYFVSLPSFPVGVVKERINAALRMLGEIPVIDKLTLSSVSGQTEYAQAVAWKKKPPIKIELQSSTTSGDTEPILLTGWKVEPTTAGSAGLIRFPYAITAGYYLYVTYLGIHPTLNLYTDVIQEYFSPELVVAASAYKLAQWYNARQGGKDGYWIQKVNETRQIYTDTKRTLKSWKPQNESGYSYFPQV